jgi:glucosamine--fructose-6-phosphate aminotransferase (isomerizing)
MCSIIGVYGLDETCQAAPVMVQGLTRMEYRGYDSVGLATASKKAKLAGSLKRPRGNDLKVLKAVGRVAEVNRNLGLSQMTGRLGIGHTRWATHGESTPENAHPHMSIDGSIAVVHNGIIENYQEIKLFLDEEAPGVYSYKSQTDSEVIPHLIHWAFQNDLGIPEVCERLEGDYAFIALFQDGTMIAVKNHKPLIMGVSSDAVYFASDVLGFINHTDRVIYPDNQQFVRLDQYENKIEIFDFDGNPVEYEAVTVSKELADVYKGEYAHFTIKEIHEQPVTICTAAQETQDELRLMAEFMKHTPSLFITGSGTSYHAGLVAKQLLTHAKINAEVVIASETPYLGHRFDHQSVLLALSQSGESADVLDTVSRAKEGGAKIVSIVNTMTSSLAHESSICVGLNCGPEIGVAATKSFTSQLSIMYQILGCLKGEDYPLASTCEAVEELLDYLTASGQIIKLAREMSDISDLYVLGRGIHWPIAVEGALKLKEITYIHAEGIAGGELKHGPLALMDEDTYVILINPSDETHKDTLTSASQIKARGAKIIGISDEPSDLFHHWIALPKKKALFPILEIVPIQLLSYHLALERANDPDYPRNLAKSVTVK